MTAANALAADLGGKRMEMNASEQAITNPVTDLLKIITLSAFLLNLDRERRFGVRRQAERDPALF
jgi:hypothetical protein